MTYTVYDDICEVDPKTGKYRCIPCRDNKSLTNDKRNKWYPTSQGFGTHFGRWCNSTSLSQEEKHKILTKAHDFRGRHSEAGQRYEAKRKEKPERKQYMKEYEKNRKKGPERKQYMKEYGKEWRNKPENIRYMKNYLKEWSQSAKGRKSQKLRSERYFKSHPWKKEVMKAIWKEWSKTGHRISKPKCLNKSFADKIKDQDKLRCEHLVEIEDGIKFEDFSYFVQLLAQIQDSFKNVDSRVSNYVYLLLDLSDWRDDETFGEFLDRVFYVGRGVGPRFMAHLIEAQTILKNKHEVNLKDNPKEFAILNTWKNGPVGVLIINLDKYAEKTDFVEFAITYALGLDNLTNKKFDGSASVPLGFNIDDVCNTAVYYLARAFENRSKRLECFHDDDFGEKRTWKD